MKKSKWLCLLLCMLLVLSGCTKKETSKDTINDIPNSKDQVGQDADAKDNEHSDEVGEEDQSEKLPEVVEKIDVNIGALKGPTAIGMVKVMQDADNGETSNNYNFTIAGAADEISAGLIKGDLDIAAVPCNLAAVLYQKTNGQINMAAINTLGVLYIVETGDTINGVEDLKGKTIYSTGYGTTPQYTLNYLLNAYGIDPEKDVTIEYKTEATEVAAALADAEDAIAMLPQPYVTTVMMNNDKVRIALDIAKEWEKVSEDGSSVVTGVVVVRKDFIENHKDVVDAFMEEYQASVTYVQENTEDAANLVENYGIVKAAVAKKAIPYCNIVFLAGEDMKTKANGYLNALFAQNPAAVGGQMPVDEFYYVK